jgi:hypothetical protein
MIMKSRLFFLTLMSACFLAGPVSPLRSQSTQPIVVQAATGDTAATTKSAQSTVIAENAAATQVAIQTLERIKAANDEVLKRQLATLQQLEEIQQAADELKIFAKRG